MSSGWPPEEDDHRWEPVRRASVVGAGHDSRGAERGYSSYGRYTPGAGESGGFGPYDLPPSYEEDGWGASGPVGLTGPVDAAHPSGPLPGTDGGYGGIGGADLYGAPVYTEADYQQTDYNEAGSAGGAHDAAQYGNDAQYEDGGHEEAEYGRADHGQAQPGPARRGEELYAGGSYGPGQYGGAQDGAGEYAGGYDGGQYAEDGYEPDGRHPGAPGGYQPGGYEGHEDAGNEEIGYGTGAGHQQAGYAGYPGGGDGPGTYRETGYQQAGYHGDADGSRGYQAPAPGPQGARQQGSGPRDYRSQDYGQRDYGQRASAGQQGSGPQDYGYQDYGDPGYDDPTYGDLAYDDTPYPASADRGTPQAGPAYPGEGFQDAGYDGERHGSGGYPGQPGPAAGYGSGAFRAVAAPGYADGEYDGYPDAGDLPGPRADDGYAAAGYDGAGYGNDPGRELAPQDAGGRVYPGDGYGSGSEFADAAPGPGDGSYGPGEQPGYVAAEYASGQYPPGAGTIGELSAGMPDPAATGMMDATGILDSTGLSDSVELYNYHPGAAEASQGFMGAPAPVGTLEITGLGPSGFLDDPAFADDGNILDGAEAGDATGVLEGGSGFFDAEPAETTSIDHLPAGSLSRGATTGGTGALVRPRPGSRPAGRRRGRSGDRRLWVALGGVVVVFVGALVAIVMVAFPSGPGGPAHTTVTPNQLNAFIRRPALELQMNVPQLRQDVVNMSSGQARHVVEAVYESGNSTSGTTPQIVLFIGGNLLNAAPNVSVTRLTQRFKGAKITNAGGPGEAACVNATASEPGSVAMCAWFDNDSFGEVLSPTMNASALASTMRQIRPHVELVVKQKQ
ncbi:MAG: hypothetical protein ABSF03_22665 [Streptosporangiaceae bacterium]